MHTVISTIACVRLPRGDSLRKIWIVASVLYAAARALAFDIFLGQYGVRGEIYFIVEVLTAIPFAHFSADLLKALKDRGSKAKSLAGATCMYIAPDLYLIIEARDAPANVYVATLAVIAAFALASLVWLVRKSRISNP